MAKKSKSPKNSDDSAVVEVSVPEGLSAFMTPLAILISAVMVSVSILYSGSRSSINDDDESTLGATEESDTQEDENTAETVEYEEPGDYVRDYETFTEYDTDVCKEDGKPMVFLFSTTWCPHCEWIKDTFDKWAKDNSDKISAYHWELDTGDNTLTSKTEDSIPDKHNEIYSKFNPSGSIPTYVFGCRYSRVGNGYESEEDLGKEKASFEKVMKELL